MSAATIGGATPDGHVVPAEARVGEALAFFPRRDIVAYVREQSGLALCGVGATCPGGA